MKIKCAIKKYLHLIIQTQCSLVFQILISFSSYRRRKKKFKLKSMKTKLFLPPRGKGKKTSPSKKHYLTAPKRQILLVILKTKNKRKKEIHWERNERRKKKNPKYRWGIDPKWGFSSQRATKWIDGNVSTFKKPPPYPRLFLFTSYETAVYGNFPPHTRSRV